VGAGAGLRPWERLRRQAEFRTVFRRGRRTSGRLFLLLVHPNGLAWSRLGMAVARGFGDAVVRNRARRLIREGFKRLRGSHPGLDVVVVGRAALRGCRLGVVERELRRQLDAAAGGRARRADPARGD
jgi:ribonuclease P protein component